MNPRSRPGLGPATPTATARLGAHSPVHEGVKGHRLLRPTPRRIKRHRPRPWANGRDARCPSMPRPPQGVGGGVVARAWVQTRVAHPPSRATTAECHSRADGGTPRRRCPSSSRCRPPSCRTSRPSRRPVRVLRRLLHALLGKNHTGTTGASPVAPHQTRLREHQILMRVARVGLGVPAPRRADPFVSVT